MLINEAILHNNNKWQIFQWTYSQWTKWSHFISVSPVKIKKSTVSWESAVFNPDFGRRSCGHLHSERIKIITFGHISDCQCLQKANMEDQCDSKQNLRWLLIIVRLVPSLRFHNLYIKSHMKPEHGPWASHLVCNIVWMLTLVFDLDPCLWVILFDDPWLLWQEVSS